MSPYFFNAGLFHDGAMPGRIAAFYADALAYRERYGVAATV